MKKKLLMFGLAALSLCMSSSCKFSSEEDIESMNQERVERKRLQNQKYQVNEIYKNMVDNNIIFEIDPLNYNSRKEYLATSKKIFSKSYEHFDYNSKISGGSKFQSLDQWPRDSIFITKNLCKIVMSHLVVDVMEPNSNVENHYVLPLTGGGKIVILEHFRGNKLLNNRAVTNYEEGEIIPFINEDGVPTVKRIKLDSLTN